MPTALVLRTAGTNCEEELVRAFELAGADVSLVHLDRAIEDPSIVTRHHIVAFPGGFSYGDDIASGRIFAMRVREGLCEPLRDAVAQGTLVLGVCNGFQVLVQAGLLPGVTTDQTAALVLNQTGRFRDDWATLEVDRASKCVWTRDLGDTIAVPYANGEGRFVASEQTLDELEAQGQVALRYSDTVNGSMRRIAGICDPTGRVLGLMPHPERFLDWNRHPFWTRLDPSERRGDTPGLRVFKNAVEAASSVAV